MKKILAAFLFVLVLVFLSGCSFFSKKEEVPAAPPEEVQMERKIGIVNTAQALNVLTAPSKFVLVMEAGEPLFIDSATVNLRRYKGRRVEAEGKWNDDKTVFLIENVAQLTQDASSKTAFQSTGLGVKFSYPSLWILKEEKNVLGGAKVFITPYEVEESEMSSVDVITMERSENNRKLSAREWLGLDENYRLAQAEGGVADADAPVYQQSRIGVGQMDAVKATVSGGDEIRFYVSRDTFLYVFTHRSAGDSEKDQYRNVFYDIVMSFEFIPFSDKVAVTPPPAAQPSPSASPQTAPQVPPSSPAPSPAETSSAPISASRQQFVDFIKNRISELAPEAPSNGSPWSVLSVEFAYPEGEPENFSAVYVVYGAVRDLRRILLNVPDRTAPEKMTRLAYFKPGDTTDWQLAEGTDSAKGAGRTKINVASGNEEANIKKGMTLLEARLFKIKIQYPSGWYWASVNGGYNFSNKPVSGENVLVRLTKDPQTLPETMAKSGELGGRPATEGQWAEAVSLCVQAAAKFCLSGDPSYRDTMRQMLETLQE